MLTEANELLDRNIQCQENPVLMGMNYERIHACPNGKIIMKYRRDARFVK